ncbi:MAG: hypothetical protein RIC56_15575 [Pseudomonadales bacterium]
MPRSRNPDNLIRPLHRQRGRHKTVRVLGEAELIALLGVSAAELPERLTAIGWRYHEDSVGRVWATEQTLPAAPG